MADPQITAVFGNKEVDAAMAQLVQVLAVHGCQVIMVLAATGTGQGVQMVTIPWPGITLEACRGVIQALLEAGLVRLGSPAPGPGPQ